MRTSTRVFCSSEFSLKNEYSYIVSLRFYYNLRSLIRRSEFFIDSFTDQAKRFRSTVAKLFVSCYDNKDLCFPSTCIVRTYCGQSVLKHVSAPKLLCHVVNWFMLLAVRLSSYGCTWEVRTALKKLELLSAIASSNSNASFVLSKLSAFIHNSIYAR